MAKILMHPYTDWDSETNVNRDEWDATETQAITATRKEIMRRVAARGWYDRGDSDLYDPDHTVDCDDYDREPCVPIEDLYNLGNAATVTVNRYSAGILNTRNMLIADVDVSGASAAKFLHKYPACNPLFDNLAALKDLDDLAGTKFADQTYRIYRTHSGFRVICATLPMDRQDARMKTMGNCWLRFMSADPYYISLCDEHDNYRARLTPKPDRVDGQDGFTNIFDLMDGLCVTFFTESCCPSELPNIKPSRGAVIHPDLVEQIRLHDEMCLPLADHDGVA